MTYADGTHSIPQCQHIKFGCRGITPKKEYNIHNMTKVWNQEWFQLINNRYWSNFQHSWYQNMPVDLMGSWAILIYPSLYPSIFIRSILLIIHPFPCQSSEFLISCIFIYLNPVGLCPLPLTFSCCLNLMDFPALSCESWSLSLCNIQHYQLYLVELHPNCFLIKYSHLRLNV